MTTSTHHCSSYPAENLAAGTHPKAYGTYTYLHLNASHPIRCVVDRTNASKLVRALHTSRDPQRFGLLQDTLLLVHDCLIDVMERDHWLLADAEFCADMAAVFFGIALDSSSYVFEGDEREVYLYNVIAGLCACTSGFTFMKHTTQLPHLGIDAILQKADQLFKFIWSHKQWFSQSKATRPLRRECSHPVEEWSFMDHVLKFAIGLRHMIVFREDLELNSLITDGRYLHVALYCWLDNHDSTLDTHVIDILSQLNLHITPLDRREQEKIARSFIPSVITPDLADTLTKKVSSMFTDPNLSSEALDNLLEVCATWFMCCPQFLNPSTDEVLCKLMYDWSAVFERQICSQGLLPEDRAPSHGVTTTGQNIRDLEARMLLFGWGMMDAIIEQRRQRGSLVFVPGMTYRRIWLATVTTIGSKIMPLMAYTLTHHLVTLPHKRAMLLCDILAGPLQNIATFLTHKPQSIPTTALEQVEVLKNSIRPVWFPIMALLMQYCASLSDTTNDPKAHRLLSSWASLCGLCDIDVWDPEIRNAIQPPRDPVDYSKPKWWKGLGCGWNMCLCRQNPDHRMKLCKGCLQVVYCGARCQALDWKKGGHRKTCPGRRGSTCTDLN